MELRKNRTLICSVVFLDIVGYSKLPVARQHEVKSVFNTIVGETIARIPDDERIILDTGDGAALCFIGDPEDALFVSMDLRNAFGEVTVGGQPFPGVRIGINLGPVRAVQDLNGQVNLIGDGINVGQRIMSFCDTDQILVSRSYYEVVGCLSTKHAALFKYHGERKDKHVREHVIYEVHLESQTADDPSVEAVEVAKSTSRPEPITLTAEQRAAAEHALVHEVGPLAKVLVRRAARSAVSEEVFYGTLAAAIPEGPRRDAFLDRFLDQAGPEREPSTRPAVDPAQPSAAAPDGEDDGVAWTDDDLERATHALAEYIGPLASVLVERAAGQHATRDGLYDALAAEISDAAGRRRFLETVRAEVG